MQGGADGQRTVHRGDGDRHQSGGDGQAGGTADAAGSGGDSGTTGGYTAGQTGASDGGHGGVAGTPSHAAGEVLSAAVAVGSGGGVLLSGSLGDLHISGSHADGDQHGSGDGQAGGTVDGTGSGGDGGAAGTYTAGQASGGDGGHGGIAGTPSHAAAQVLGAAVAIGAGCRELLSGAFGNGRIGRSDGDRYQGSAAGLIDLLDLGSGEGDAVESQVVDLSGGKLAGATARKQVQGVIAERVGVGGGVKILLRSLQHTIDVEGDDVGAGLSLVIDDSDVVPGTG